MLDGGFTAWAAGGYPVARDAEVVPAQAFPFTQDPDVVATYQDVLRLIDAQDGLHYRYPFAFRIYRRGCPCGAGRCDPGRGSRRVARELNRRWLDETGG